MVMGGSTSSQNLRALTSMSYVPMQGKLSPAVLVVMPVVPGISEGQPRANAFAILYTGPLPAAAT